MAEGTLPKYLIRNRDEALAAADYLLLDELANILRDPHRKKVNPPVSGINSSQHMMTTKLEETRERMPVLSDHF